MLGRLKVPEFYQTLASPRLLAAKAANEFKNLSRNLIPTQVIKQQEFEEMMLAGARQGWAFDPPPLKYIYKYWRR